MNAVLTATRSDIRRRKLQTFVIAFVILLSSGAATLALSLLVESDAPYEHAFAQANGAHVVVTYAAHKVGATRLRVTASAPGVTAAVGPWPQVIALYTTGSADQGNQQGGGLFIVGRPGPGGAVDRLTMESGRWAQAPGEVVIARQLADSWGLRVGTYLAPGPGFHLPSLRVVGIAASISPYTDAWVTPAEIKRMVTRKSPLQYQMLYRVNPAGTANDLGRATQSIARGLPTGAVVNTNNYLDAKKGADLLSSVMVPFLLAFSAFALLASILIIVNVVSGVVIAGYRDIGIMKSVGFTPGQVMSVLLGLILLPALAGCLIGIPLGTAGSQPFLQQTAHAFGLPAPFTAAIPVDLFVLVTILSVAALAALGPSWRAGHLSAVSAITTGSAPAVGRGSRIELALTRLPLPRALSLGIADVISRPLRSAMTMGAILLGVATVVFALSLHLSLGQVAAHLIRGQYVQVDLFRSPPDSGGLRLKPGASNGETPPPQMSDRQMTRLLQSNPGTARFVAETSEQVVVAGIAQPINFYAYRGPSAWTGYALISGRWFSRPGEVVAPTRLLAQSHLRVGQSFTAQLSGRTMRLRLVGEILDQTDNNLLLRGSWATLRAADPRIQPFTYEVQIRNGIDARAYLGSLVQRLGGQGGINADIVEGSSEDSSFLLLDGVIAALALVLIAIAVTGVFNTVILTTREKVRDVAILKAVGMAPHQVVSMVLTSVVLLGLVAGVLGIPLGLLLHAQVISLMAHAASGSNIPPSFFDLINHTELPLLALAGVLIAALGAWMPAQWAASSGVAEVLQTE
jgi:putative ABC transport system permease protein